MIEIIIADDHKIVRDGLRKIVEESGAMKVVAEAANSRETVQEVNRCKPDLVILDVRMPGRGPLETLQEIKARSPRTRVLMLTAQPEDYYAVRLLKAGADGYLTKEINSEELTEAIKRVLQGRKYISTNLAETIALSVDIEKAATPHEALSRRELEVMLRIAEGMTIQDIAEELALSPKTVSTYRSRVLEKLDFKGNAELIRYAVRAGLVD